MLIKESKMQVQPAVQIVRRQFTKLNLVNESISMLESLFQTRGLHVPPSTKRVVAYLIPALIKARDLSDYYIKDSINSAMFSPIIEQTYCLDPYLLISYLGRTLQSASFDKRETADIQRAIIEIEGKIHDELTEDVTKTMQEQTLLTTVKEIMMIANEREKVEQGLKNNYDYCNHCVKLAIRIAS